jgi:hypothetical protein
MSTSESFESEEGALLRARLHIRGGRRRLRQGKISAGLLTLYDALMFALRWYVASPERRSSLRIREGDDLKDDRTVFMILKESGVADPSVFDYEAFDKLVEKASGEEMPDFDYEKVLRGFEAFMTRIGVMPFDEALLPAEDPSTF